MDLVGIQLARLDQFLDLGDGDLPGHGHHGVEIPGRPLEDEVSVGIPFPGFHQGKVRP